MLFVLVIGAELKKATVAAEPVVLDTAEATAKAVHQLLQAKAPVGSGVLVLLLSCCCCWCCCRRWSRKGRAKRARRRRARALEKESLRTAGDSAGTEL